MDTRCHGPSLGMPVVRKSEWLASGPGMLRAPYQDARGVVPFFFSFFFLQGLEKVFQPSIAQEPSLIPTDSPSSEIIST